MKKGLFRMCETQNIWLSTHLRNIFGVICTVKRVEKLNDHSKKTKQVDYFYKMI